MSEHPDIVVNAFTARYSAAYAKLAPIEGGFSNDPHDRGGPTNHGVSLRFLVGEGMIDVNGDGINDFDLDMDGDLDIADIRALQPIDAKYLFQRCFWLPAQCDRFAAPIGEALFDQAVNGGMTAARRLLQRAINSCLGRLRGAPSAPAILKADAVIGDATRTAFDYVLKMPGLGMPALIAAYRSAAVDRYREIVAKYPSQRKYIRGWEARANTLGKL